MFLTPLNFFLSGLMSDSVQVGEEIAGDEERSGMK